MESINGYSQEEAARSINSSDDGQSNNELENLLKLHQESSECLIDLND